MNGWSDRCQIYSRPKIFLTSSIWALSVIIFQVFWHVGRSNKYKNLNFVSSQYLLKKIQIKAIIFRENCSLPVQPLGVSKAIGIERLINPNKYLFWLIRLFFPPRRPQNLYSLKIGSLKVKFTTSNFCFIQTFARSPPTSDLTKFVSKFLNTVKVKIDRENYHKKFPFGS